MNNKLKSREDKIGLLKDLNNKRESEAVKKFRDARLNERLGWIIENSSTAILLLMNYCAATENAHEKSVAFIDAFLNKAITFPNEALVIAFINHFEASNMDIIETYSNNHLKSIN